MKILFQTLLVFIALPALAEPVPACSTDPGFRQFDFWLGTWSVSNNADGKPAGVNNIRKLEGECALLESWKSASGGTGTSINYYNPNTGKWRQLWISAGYSIDISGGIEADSMQLEGEIYYYEGATTAAFKGRWTPLAHGEVRQHFQQYDAETKRWVDWFDGRYTPMENAQAHE